MIERIKKIWSDETRKQCCIEIWGEFIRTARRLSFRHPELEKLYPVGTDVVYENKTHQIVRWLEEAANKFDCPNLHTGMTSSDVEENARLMQISKSINVIREIVTNVQTEITVRLVGEWLGRTHLQPAGIVSLRNLMWQRCLDGQFQHVHPKRPAGILGNLFETPPSNIWVIQSMDWEILGFKGAQHIEQYVYRQGTGCKQELLYVHSLSVVAAGVVKIASDLRYLHSIGEILIEDRTASSSDPTKNNPTQFEKAESIAYGVHTAYTSIWQVMAHDGLEGTLNRRWCLDHELARATEYLVSSLMALKSGLTRTNRVIQDLPPKESFPSKILAERVISGERRDVVYNELYGDGSTTTREDTDNDQR